MNKITKDKWTKINSDLFLDRKNKRVTHDIRKNWAYDDVFAERPEQRAVFEDPSDCKILVCGRRWGKSTVMRESAIHIAKTIDEAVCWIVGPNKQLTKPVFWRPLINRLKHLGYKDIKSAKSEEEELKMLVGKTKRTKKNTELDDVSVPNKQMVVHIAGSYLELENDLGGVSYIYLKSAVKDESLVGSGLDFLGIDEFRYLRPGVFEEQLMPSLDDREGKLLIISTANGRDKLYDLFIRGQRTEDEYIDGWKSWLFWTETNPYYPLYKIEKRKRESTPELFEQEYHCNFDTAQGLVYSNFRFDRHMKELDIDNDIPMRLAFDFNFALQACSAFQIKDGNSDYLNLKSSLEILEEQDYLENEGKRLGKTAIRQNLEHFNSELHQNVLELRKLVEEHPIKEQEKVIHLLKCINTKQCWIETQCNNVLKWLDEIGWTGDLIFYGDYTGQYKSSASPTTNWNIIKRKFKHYKCKFLLEYPPDETVRINAFQKQLINASDEVGIYFNSNKDVNKKIETQPMIDDMCQIEIEDGWSRINSKKMERKSLTHNSDALGYAIFKEFAIKKKSNVKIDVMVL